MTKTETDALIERQREFFKSGATLSAKYRTEHLKKLYRAILKYEKEITEALCADLGKSSFESYMCEIGMVLEEISYMIKHTAKLSKEKRVRTPVSQFPSRSYIQRIPYGNTLIMSPWNYPLLLTLDPLASAIAAGNTAVLKPSGYSPNTSEVIVKIVKECFAPEYVSVVIGGREENSALLSGKFDFIFFTGSQAVGKEVLRHAAEDLTPVVLELGGKSPCIIDKSADIPLAARRIVFGKFLNCGQTCAAPDYILCHSSVRDKFIGESIREIIRQFGEDALLNENYGKIINEKHYRRLISLIDPSKLVFGGNTDDDRQRLSPTLLSGVTFDDPVMKEEIFGPIMPILTFDDFDEMTKELKDKPKPLALYLFTSDKNQIKKVTEQLSYGGGCINDVIIHLATTNMPFGGVGQSGMGAYHGKDGFEAFSHRKSIVDKKTWLDIPLRYQPYTKKKEGMLRRFLK